MSTYKQCPYALEDAHTHLKYFCQLECGHVGGHESHVPKWSGLADEKLVDNERWVRAEPSSSTAGPLTTLERADVLAAIKRTESMWGGGCVELRRLLQAHDWWKRECERMKLEDAVELRDFEA